MRLWTIHPRYLDSQGLVALWREALLARAVLRGETRGYRHHPQLIRFRAHRHLLKKLAVRDPALRRRSRTVTVPQCHPLFRPVTGPIESWERTGRDPHHYSV
jgi:hypothetical protein